MGWRNVADARDYSRANGSAYTVLVMLAERAPDETRRCHPGLKLLACDSRVDRATVQRGLKKLEALGEIEPVAYRDGGRGKATEWAILVGPGMYETTWAEEKGLQDATPERAASDPERAASTPSKGRSLPPRPEGTEVEPNSLHEQGAIIDPVWMPVIERIVDVGSRKRNRARRRQVVTPTAAEIIGACESMPDRAHTIEAEKFRDYWLDGKGMNRDLSDVGRAWINWLKSAPDASAYERRAVAGPAGGGDKGPTSDEIRAEAERLKAEGL